LSSLPAQPYQVSDFSGGMTENFIGGGPTRYMAADNFLVTVDKKLEERYGSVLFGSNYQLPSGNTPVNALIPHDVEQFLLGVACPNIYVLNPSWQSLLGPTGNPPLAGGNYASAISWAEAQHTTLITDDSLNTNPVKIYRGAPLQATFPAQTTFLPIAGINNFQAVTAGLPAMVGNQNITDSALLAACITLANDLRTQMMAHFQDYGGAIDTNLHQAFDVIDYDFLFGSSVAIDQTSLLNLIPILVGAYTQHAQDVLMNPFTFVYHWNANALISGVITFLLDTTTPPTTLIQAAAILDDLKTKFWLHEMDIGIHDTYNNYGVIGRHLVTTPHIGTVTTGPVIVPTYPQTYNLVNTIRTAFDAHAIDLTYHKAADTHDAVTYPTATDLDSFFALTAILRWKYQLHYADSALITADQVYHYVQNTDTANETLGPPTNQVYAPNSTNIANWLSTVTALLTAYNAHDSNSLIHHNSNQHTANAYVPTISSYAYAFHYFYQYMRYDGIVLQVVGPPLLVGPVFAETITPYFIIPTGLAPASTLTITNIPVLNNGSGTSYDTANDQVKIFRTINAGNTYYQVGIVTNGTTTFTDANIDVANPYLASAIPITENPPIYTAGGVVKFDPAPVCKYVTSIQNTMYYAAVVDTGQTFLNRIRQGIQNQVDSSPGSFFVDLPESIMGISSTRNNLVAFCTHSVYQVTGAFTPTGQGQMIYQSISDTIGCVSSESIVRTDVGIFFAGTDGFYYTDGFQLIKLSSELNQTYLNLVSDTKQQSAIYGCYDRYLRRVWWSTQSDASDFSADSSWIFHVNYGVTANGVFTTASNGENYRPSSMVFWQGMQLRGDARGYIFQHTILAQTDPLVNINTVATSWPIAYIPYNYASCAVDFGTTFNRKWLTRISFQGKNVGNVGAQITSTSDNGRVPPLVLSPLWFNKNLMWGNPNIIWGQSNLVWGDTQEIDMWRRFPATQLRADYKQIAITPAKIGVYRYQDWPPQAGAVVTSNGMGVATAKLITPPWYTALIWPLDVVGYVFATQIDGYIQEYPITAITTTTNAGDTLTLSDPGNTLSTTPHSVAWVVRGILKQQRISLTSYAIHFTLLGKMQRAYRGSQDAGENAPGLGFSTSYITTEDGGDITTEDGDPLITETPQ